MAKRCDNCKHWSESVFLGSSASGYGCWEGRCHHPEVPQPRVGERARHNLMLACQKFEEGAHPHSLQAMADSKKPNVEFNGVPAGHSSNHPAGGTSAGTQG